MTRAVCRVVAAVWAMWLTACTAPHPDTVLLNGKVFTSDPAQPWAEALAIKGSRIVAVGATAVISAQAGASTRRLDLGGRTVVPGFNDAHAHVVPEAPTGRLSSGDDPSVAELEAALAAAVQQAPAAQWLQGSFGEAVWSDPAVTRAWLDARAPHHPVRLNAFTGHGVILNSRALAIAGIDDGMGDPEGGRFLRDAAGRLNGRGEEYADWLFGRRIAERVDASTAASAYRRFGDEAARFGITSIQLIGDVLPIKDLVSRLVEARSPLRWRVFRFPMREAGAETADGGPHLPPQPTALIDARGMKFILDGTPIERLAWMSAPYTDAPGERGRLNVSPERLRTFVGWGYGTEDVLVVHAIGDAAIDAYLTALEHTGIPAVWREKRPRLEHGDMITAAELVRARALGLVIVQNPSHFLFRDVFVARYGAARVAAMQPMRSLVDAGIPLAIGSDGPLNPFLNILWASTHPTNPGEALTREQAVTAYTRGSAYAESADRDKGFLAPGALADLAVLSADVFTAPADAMASIRSVLTLVGGAVAFDAGIVH